MSASDVSRRLVLGALAAAPAVPVTASAAEDEIRAALMAFLKAFADCDLPRMEAAFASDANCFDRTVMSARGAPGLRLDDWRRIAGMPPGMRKLAQSLPATQPGPPYQTLEPLDLLIQASADMAVCTFHLVSPHVLCRRTIVMARRSGLWKIIHIHASNVDDRPA